MIKIAVVGSREYKDLAQVTENLFLLQEHLKGRFKVITGGARGVDQTAMQWCASNKTEVEVIAPRDPNNKLDYLFRNVEILTKADIILIFWDGKSRGTKFVLDYARHRNKGIRLFMQEGR